MNKGLNYIFQLSKDDLREIANAVDPKPGFCINIEKTKDGILISLDKTALALAINGFYRNGGCTTSAANCVNISFDPPS